MWYKWFVYTHEKSRHKWDIGIFYTKLSSCVKYFLIAFWKVSVYISNIFISENLSSTRFDQKFHFLSISGKILRMLGSDITIVFFQKLNIFSSQHLPLYKRRFNLRFSVDVTISCILKIRE